MAGSGKNAKLGMGTMLQNIHNFVYSISVLYECFMLQTTHLNKFRKWGFLIRRRTEMDINKQI